MSWRPGLVRSCWWACFLRRVSSLAAFVWHGVLPSSLVSGCFDCWSASFRATKHASVAFCAILVGLGVDFAILTFGRYFQARADGEPHQQAIVTSVAKLGTRGVLWCAHNGCRLSRSGAEWRDGIFSTRCADCHRHFLWPACSCARFCFCSFRAASCRWHDWLFQIVKKYVRWTVKRPGPMLIFSRALLLRLP